VSIVPRIYEAMTQVLSSGPSVDAFQELAAALKSDTKSEKSGKPA
jgi:hypothetical protein